MHLFDDCCLEIKRNITIVNQRQKKTAKKKKKNKEKQKKTKNKPGDLYQKIQEVKGKFKAKRGMLNDQQQRTLSTRRK